MTQYVPSSINSLLSPSISSEMNTRSSSMSMSTVTERSSKVAVSSLLESPKSTRDGENTLPASANHEPMFKKPKHQY